MLPIPHGAVVDRSPYDNEQTLVGFLGYLVSTETSVKVARGRDTRNEPNKTPMRLSGTQPL